MTLITLLVVAVLFMGITVAVYKKFWDYQLTARVEFLQKEIEEGQSLTIKEIVENRKILPLPTLLVKFETDRSIQCIKEENSKVTDKMYRSDCISVMSYQRVTHHIDAIGTSRGFFGVNPVYLVATDILFRSIFTKKVENDSWVYVYPRRSKFIQLPEILRRMSGEYLTEQRLREDSLEFYGIRDYAQTDPMRKINWKVSAKTGGLKVNQYFDSISRRFTIFLNVSQKGNQRYYDLIEESIRIARNFIEEFVSKGIPVRIISNGVDKLTRQEIYIKEGAGVLHIDACLKQLSRMDIYGEVRNMEELIYEQRMKEGKASEQGEVSLLLSAEQSPELAEAYLEYAGEAGSANWVIPIHKAMKEFITEQMGVERMRGTSGQYIRTEYLIMEELEG